MISETETRKSFFLVSQNRLKIVFIKNIFPRKIHNCFKLYEQLNLNMPHVFFDLFPIYSKQQLKWSQYSPGFGQV